MNRRSMAFSVLAVGIGIGVAVSLLSDAALIGALILAAGGAVGCAWHIVRHAVKAAQTRRLIKRSVRFYNCGQRGGK